MIVDTRCLGVVIPLPLHKICWSNVYNKRSAEDKLDGSQHLAMKNKLHGGLLHKLTESMGFVSVHLPLIGRQRNETSVVSGRL